MSALMRTKLILHVLNLSARRVSFYRLTSNKLIMSEEHRRDPWARFEAWRHAPEINRRANVKRMLPGFRWGVAAFLVLVAVEELYWKPTHPKDDHAH